MHKLVKVELTLRAGGVGATELAGSSFLGDALGGFGAACFAGAAACKAWLLGSNTDTRACSTRFVSENVGRLQSRPQAEFGIHTNCTLSCRDAWHCQSCWCSSLQSMAVELIDRHQGMNMGLVSKVSAACRQAQS